VSGRTAAPPVRSLQEQYAIAGGTAQAALRALRAEGLADTGHGRGSFVADSLPPGSPRR
jgi:DNA-binding GntR family transcriptional regulator